MCGIYGYIGRENAYHKVKQGLHLLQYRGYDSCGIAYYHNGFEIEKTIGVLDNLHDITIETSLAFGHTRWATNGEVSIRNTHPHTSQHGEFVLVHNGIITNADSIKDRLLQAGYQFYSDTDTEVIANLLESIDGTHIDKVKNLYRELEGSFSLIIGDRQGRIYLVKQFSPLHILRSDNAIYISSDVSSIPNGDLYSLNDGDIVIIEDGLIIGVDDWTPYVNENDIIGSTNYPHHMLKEINDTPQAIYDTYTELNSTNISDIFKRYTRLTMLACGTAYNSCLIGARLFNQYTDKVATSVLASNYDINKVADDHLHVIVSQSGETADCIKVARKIKEIGGKILVITNEDKSTITQYADYKLYTRAKKELAVASTKTYCCQLFSFAYIVNTISNRNAGFDINKFVRQVAEHISSINIVDYATTLKSSKHLILIGKGMDYLTMIEASLKIREIDYVYTIPMFASELKHGTLSLIDENTYILALSSTVDNDLSTTKNEIKSRHGKVLTFDQFTKDIDVDSTYLPILTIIPFQLLSYEIAIIDGRNPDMPRNLAKSVTVE